METCGYTSNIIFNGCTCQKGIYGYPHTQDFLHYPGFILCMHFSSNTFFIKLRFVSIITL